jgi:hypothetical protein
MKMEASAHHIAQRVRYPTVMAMKLAREKINRETGANRRPRARRYAQAALSRDATSPLHDQNNERFARPTRLTHPTAPNNMRRTA